MNSRFDFVSRRKIIYPFFVAIFCIVILVFVFFYFFSQSLEVTQSAISVSGENLVLNISVKNASNHVVKDPVVVIFSNGDKVSVPLKSQNNVLFSGESYQTVVKFPLTDSNFYEVFVESPFNRPIKLFFEIEESTLRPVKAEVILSSKMVVGTKYDVIVKLCNVSSNDLFEVSWLEIVESNYFDEALDTRSISLKVNECKNLYSTLTPINSGKTRMSFLLRVGSLEQKLSQEIEIEEN